MIEIRYIYRCDACSGVIQEDEFHESQRPGHVHRPPVYTGTQCGRFLLCGACWHKIERAVQQIAVENPSPPGPGPGS